MRFSAKQIRQITAGQLTQTRIPHGTGGRLKAGRSLPVHRQDAEGRTHLTEHRILILDVKPTTLGDLTFKDARAEGYRTTDEALERWRTPTGRITRSRLVIVVRFTLDADQDIYLAPRLGRPLPPGDHTAAQERGYTTTTKRIDDAASIPLAELERYATFARGRDDQRRLELVREARSRITADVSVLKEHLAGEGFDKSLRKNVRAIEHQLNAIERKAG